MKQESGLQFWNIWTHTMYVMWVWKGIRISSFLRTNQSYRFSNTQSQRCSTRRDNTGTRQPVSTSKLKTGKKRLWFLELQLLQLIFNNILILFVNFSGQKLVNCLITWHHPNCMLSMPRPKRLMGSIRRQQKHTRQLKTMTMSSGEMLSGHAHCWITNRRWACVPFGLRRARN